MVLIEDNMVRISIVDMDIVMDMDMDMDMDMPFHIPGFDEHRSHGIPHALPIVAQQSSLVQTRVVTCPLQARSLISV